MMKLSKVLVVATLAVTMLGCAAQQRRNVIIDSSGSKTDWVTSDKDSFTEGEKVYFREVVDRQAKLDLAITRARFTAASKMGDYVKLAVKSAYGGRLEGVSNDIDSASLGEEGSSEQREVAAISQATIGGVTHEATYWEKYLTKTTSGEEVEAYKVYALVSIPRKNLLKAQLQAAQKGLAQANRERNEAARANLQKSIDQLSQELE